MALILDLPDVDESDFCEWIPEPDYDEFEEGDYYDGL